MAEIELSRIQIADIVNNDSEAINAFEDLFRTISEIDPGVSHTSYISVLNNTGAALQAGDVVSFKQVGTSAVVEVEKYIADGTKQNIYFIGVVMANTLNGQIGRAMTFGELKGINASGSSVSETWSNGDILYASPTHAGGLTNVKPTAPDNVIPVAAVLSNSATAGVLLVRPTLEQNKYYGQFTKLNDQSASLTNSPVALLLTNTEISHGVTIGTPASRMIVAHAGLYKIDVNLQLISGSSSAKKMYIWFRKNGANVPNSATQVTDDINNGAVHVAKSDFFSLHANDYMEVMFAVDDTSLTIHHEAPTLFAPATPAAIISITQVQQ